MIVSIFLISSLVCLTTFRSYLIFIFKQYLLFLNELSVSSKFFILSTEYLLACLISNWCQTKRLVYWISLENNIKWLYYHNIQYNILMNITREKNVICPFKFNWWCYMLNIYKFYINTHYLANLSRPFDWLLTFITTSIVISFFIYCFRLILSSSSLNKSVQS